VIGELVSSQVNNCITSVVVGVTFGLVSGVIAGIGRGVKIPVYFAWIGDILLWFGLCATFVCVSYICCQGKIRFYILLTFFLSFLIIFFTTNWAVCKIVNYILYLTKNASKKVEINRRKLR
jgi:hypothetical protein